MKKLVLIKPRRAAAPASFPATGLPTGLQAGIEQLSGISLTNVRVHHGAARPAQLAALAYAQGLDIQVAPGQETHLPHEAWHVVQQQQQGRVQPTRQLAGIRANDDDDAALEREADNMGAKATQLPGTRGTM